MNFCKAFDSRHNPCLNLANLGQNVCGEHVDFYDPFTWFHRYPLNNQTDEDDFFFSSSDQLKRVYITAILENLVEITQEHFEDLIETGKPLESLVDYYLLCCLQKDVDPLWSMKLFNQTCKEIVSCHTQSLYPIVQTDPEFLYRFLNPLFNTNKRGFDTILYHVLWNVVFYEHTWKAPFDVPLHLDNQEVSLVQYIKDHPKFSEFLWKDTIQYDMMMTLITTKTTGIRMASKILLKFLKSIPDLQLEQKKKQKMAFQDKADEIVAVAWAPKRVRKWCLSVEDEMKLGERWPQS